MYQPTNYIPKDLTINNWSDIKPYFDKLVSENVASTADLETFLIHYSDVLSVFQEQNARAYIDMTRHTDDKERVKRHETFATTIAPQVDKVSNNIHRKIAESPFFESLPSPRYDQFKREIRRELELFREENVALDARLSKLKSDYGQLAGSLMVKWNGKKITLPRAAAYLESNDRDLRRRAWMAIMESRFAAKNEHDKILNDMIALRHQKAVNAGYKNYRDFQHDNRHRFDYTVDDVLAFHNAIEKHTIPLLKKIVKKHRERLGLSDDYRPWDTAGKPRDEAPLKPFQSGRELLEKTIRIFSKIRPEFGDNLKTMDEKGLFDVESRSGKAPGGYNYALEVTGMPFIFMNAAGLHRDVVTLMHEGGHAMHTFLTNDEPLIQYRNCPSEVTETASMSMELITSPYWNEFYNETDFIRARREHLEGIVGLFPWVAIIDAFQHWIYTHPQHSPQERDAHFDSLMERFGTGLINWEGLKKYRRNQWQKQLHIFEVPFYYIEYAIAQLGALQIYRNYTQNPQEAVSAYIRGLKLGGSRPISEVWQATNIRFDFSEETLKELMEFVEKEWEKLKPEA